MSLLTAFATEAAPLLLSDWGEAVSYLPSGGTARSITAALMRGISALEDSPNGKFMSTTAQVSVLNDATTGVSVPRTGDTITDANWVVWDFQTVADNNGGMWLLDYINRRRVETGVDT